MDTVSLSSNKIFIFADGVPEALSPADTILEMYPDTACTTSIVKVAGRGANARTEERFVKVWSSSLPGDHATSGAEDQRLAARRSVLGWMRRDRRPLEWFFQSWEASVETGR
jgi:hypothetical protein